MKAFMSACLALLLIFAALFALQQCRQPRVWAQVGGLSVAQGQRAYLPEVRQ
jgi:hypothetical protein